MEGLGVDQTFWRGKRVLVTGHTGFKGAWLILFLRQLGAEVSGISLEVFSGPSMFSVANVGEGIDSRLLDIRDYPALSQAISSIRPEVVFHLAAQSLVRVSYEVPVSTYTTNVIGTVHVLEALRHAGTARALVNVTSDKCYENLELTRGYAEQDALGGHDPYSNSKACAELVTSAYRRSFFSADRPSTCVATARAGNVIGGGDWAADRLVVDTVQAFIAGDAVTLRNPRAVRPWQHVFEPIRAYLILAQRLVQDGAQFAESWNFGPDEQDIISVESVVGKIANLWGSGSRWAPSTGKHPHETQSLRLDCSKAKNQLGWHPVWSLDRALAETVAWYKLFAGKAEMGKFSRAQVQAYLKEAQ